jgi:putative transposase
VRSICAQIPAPVRLLADGREEEFRNRYRLTYPIPHDAHRTVWQIDHKAPLHVLVRDLRAPSHRTLSGEVRPYLTLVIDSASRLVMAGRFSYDPPDRFMVAAAIRDAMLTSDHKPFGGVPDEIWVDNGKDLIAHHVHQLAQGLGITLFPGPPHEPQVRGIVERFHETLDTLCWLYGISVPKMDVFAFHFCGFSKLWHAPIKGCKSISCVCTHDAEVDAVHPHFQ